MLNLFDLYLVKGILYIVRLILIFYLLFLFCNLIKMWNVNVFVEIIYWMLNDFICEVSNFI